jgi:hypothetical protein
LEEVDEEEERLFGLAVQRDSWSIRSEKKLKGIEFAYSSS